MYSRISGNISSNSRQRATIIRRWQCGKLQTTTADDRRKSYNQFDAIWWNVRSPGPTASAAVAAEADDDDARRPLRQYKRPCSGSIEEPAAVDVAPVAMPRSSSSPINVSYTRHNTSDAVVDKHPSHHAEASVLVSNTPLTRYNRLSNRFDNRLYRVNGA